MNNQLLALYSSKWDKLSSEVKQINENDTLSIKPTNPLLIHIKNEEEFRNSDIRLMIFGQETNDWGGVMKEKSLIKDRLSGYNNFFNNDYCFKYGGQFWNGVKRFKELLQKKYPKRKISLIWNNIVKIGRAGDKGFPPDYIYEVERNYFSVIKNELQVIEPNLVLFLTGPNYDNIIKDNFEKTTFHPITPYTQRQAARISIENITFAFRTYHPNYLWRKGINGYYNAIIEQTFFN